MTLMPVRSEMGPQTAARSRVTPHLQRDAGWISHHTSPVEVRSTTKWGTPSLVFENETPPVEMV